VGSNPVGSYVLYIHMREYNPVSNCDRIYSIIMTMNERNSIVTLNRENLFVKRGEEPILTPYKPV
jgi:hypothetical protein